MRTTSNTHTTILRGGILRGGILLLSSFGLLLTSTGCGRKPASADPAISLAQPLLQLLATGDPPARVTAVTELGKLNHRVMVQPVLYAAVNDHQPLVRIAAIDALAHPNLLTEKELKSITYMLGAADLEVRMAACRALGAIKSPTTADALIHCLHDREASVRMAAADAISMMGAIAVPKMSRLFLDSGSDLRVTIAGVLAKSKDQSYARLLVPALKDDEDTVRRACAEAIGQIGITSAIPDLIALACDPLSQKTKDAFAQRLNQRPTESDFTLMIKLMDEDCDRQRRQRDRGRYYWLRDGTSHTNMFKRAINRRIRDAGDLVRSVALEAIVKIEPPDLDLRLANLLANPDEDLASQVSKILVRRGEKVRAGLITAVQDTSIPAIARSRIVDILAPAPVAVRKDGTDKLRSMMQGDDDEPIPSDTPATVPTNAIVTLPPEVLKLFLTLLADKEPSVSAAVATHLGKSGVKEAVPPLLNAFRGSDPTVIEKVLDALAVIKDERIAPVLAAALDDKKYTQQLPMIISTLGVLGDSKATPALLRIASGDGDTAMREMAIAALTSIRDPSANAPMIALLNKFYSDIKTLDAERKQSPNKAVELGERIPKLQSLARTVTRYLGAMKVRESVDSMLAMVADTTSGHNSHGDLIPALGQIGDKRAVAPISDYIKKFGGPHKRTRVNYTAQGGIDALVSIGDPAALETLKWYTAKSQEKDDPLTVGYAIEAMGRMKHPESAAVLIKYLADPNVELAIKEAFVGRALVSAGLTAKEPLIKLMMESPKQPEEAKSADPGMFAAQVLAVLEKPDVNIVPDLVRIVASKPQAHIVQRAMKALAQAHHESAIKALSDMVMKADTPTRRMAALALGEANMRSAIPALEAAMKDSDDKVRACAAMSLRSYGSTVSAEKKE